MSITACIIEDEPLAVAELKRLLQAHTCVEVLAVAENVPDAIKTIKDLNPQCMFLDINLSGKSGFEVLEALDDLPLVIFITAYDQYAIKAFEISAIDYLLKPVHPHRLAEAIMKIEKSIGNFKNEQDRLSINRKIFIKDGEKCYFVQIADISLIESIGNYARIYFSGNSPLLHKSLNYLEQKLPAEFFFRASRRYIINVNFIKNIAPFF